ncbi:MAG: hypothetical protein WCQ67_08410 [Treponema sp.]
MKIRELFLKTILPALVLTASVTLAISPVSCKITEEGIQLLTGDFSVPKIQTFTVQSNECVKLEFDKPIVKTSATVFLENKESSQAEVANILTNENKTATFTFSQKTETGKKYIIQGMVNDENGNSLTFSIPFKGYNSSIPSIAISEVRNAYSSSTNKITGAKKYKSEYIELYVLKEGNLSGLELVSAGDGEEKKYSLPAVNVLAGEYILIHLRNLEEGSIDELENNIALSTATDSSDKARDFWVQNKTARLSSSDIIILRNSGNSEILDAFVFAESSLQEWDASYKQFVQDVEASGIWVDTESNATCSVQSAVISDNITSSATTRSFSRQNVLLLKPDISSGKITNSSSQWIVTAAKGITPGYENSTTYYVKK